MNTLIISTKKKFPKLVRRNEELIELLQSILNLERFLSRGQTITSSKSRLVYTGTIFSMKEENFRIQVS